MYSLRCSNGIRIIYFSKKYTFFVGIVQYIVDMCTWMRVMTSRILLIRATNTNDHVQLAQIQTRTKKTMINILNNIP